MPTAIVIYKGDLRTEAQHVASQDNIITDAPLDNQGKGQAFSPTDLVASALASCMLTIMGIVAARHALDIVGSRAEVDKIMGSNPRRISAIHVTLFMPAAAANFDDSSRQLLENAARTCPVAQSLSPDLQQIIRFVYP
jgi:putative redox protein